MDVIAIERKTFKKMQGALQEMYKQLKEITQQYKRLSLQKEWLDNQDVCLLLRIDKRTLQTYKSKGILNCSKINRKNYFKASEVQALLKNNTINGINNDNI